MPLKRCQIGGKRGFKFGDKGKCYNSKSKALKQMRAIKRSEHKKQKSI